MSIDAVPGVFALGETNATAGFELVMVTVTPPWFGAPNEPDHDRCNPLPTVTALRLMSGVGFTVTLMLSGVMLAALAVSVVAHCSGAPPP